MNSGTLLVTIVVLAILSFLYGRQRSLLLAKKKGGIAKLHSLPLYYGYSVAVWCALPAIVLFILWLSIESGLIEKALISGLPESFKTLSTGEMSLVLNDIKLLSAQEPIDSNTHSPEILKAAISLKVMQGWSITLRTVLVLIFALAGAFWGAKKISADYRARVFVEKVTLGMLILCSVVAIITTVGIVFSVLFESTRFFGEIPASEFLFGTNWSPQTAIRSDQVGGSGTFGAIPLFVGTLLISSIAMMIAVPVGLMSAIYLAEYASSGFRSFAKPMLEVLAGVPTVVYGFFAALTVAPAIRGWGEAIGLSVASESALAAGLVMGVMIIPFVSSLSDDVISAVPRSLREGSYGMGATKSETIRQVVIPAALPGIVGGILLAVSRAIGETMIVVMAAGLAANLTVNPLQAVTTVTVQIVTLLTGDQEFDSAKTLAAFALGLMLFIATLLLNIVALYIVRKYREQYE